MVRRHRDCGKKCRPEAAHCKSPKVNCNKTSLGEPLNNTFSPVDDGDGGRQRPHNDRITNVLWILMREILHGKCLTWAETEPTWWGEWQFAVWRIAEFCLSKSQFSLGEHLVWETRWVFLFDLTVCGSVDVYDRISGQSCGDSSILSGWEVFGIYLFGLGHFAVLATSRRCNRLRLQTELREMRRWISIKWGAMCCWVPTRATQRGGEKCS